MGERHVLNMFVLQAVQLCTPNSTIKSKSTLALDIIWCIFTEYYYLKVQYFNEIICRFSSTEDPYLVLFSI